MMTSLEECSLPLSANGALKASLFPNKLCTDRNPPLLRPLARPIASHLAPSLTRPQGNKRAMNSRDGRNVDLAPLADTTMSVSSPNVLGLAHSGSTYPLHPRTPNTELILPCRATSDICFEPTTCRR